MTDLSVLGLDPDALEAIDGLSPAEAAAYIELLEQALSDHWMLTPKQEFAEALWVKVDWLLYGGSAAGGKSEFACHHANRLSEQVKGHVSLLVRQSIPELRRSLILRLIARTKQFSLPARLRKVDGQTGFHYANGSLIECGYLATDEHVGNYLSAEYDLIIMDEATQFTPDQITQLSGRLRTTKEKAARGARPHLGLFTNPGGAAHAWMYELFVTATDYGQKVIVYDVSEGFESPRIAREYPAPIPTRDASIDQLYEVLIPWAEQLEVECDPETELAVAFVPSRATDNPHIDRSYLKFLNALPEKRRRQLRDGDWDIFEGQFFNEWNRDVHVIAPFDIPEHWPRARGADYGTRNPWCCLWGAWDPATGDCYIYRESYAAGLTPEQQAKQAVEMSYWYDEHGRKHAERYDGSVADPSVFSDHRGAGRTVAQMWAQHGFVVTRAKNDRVAGWANVRQYLWDPEAEDGMGAPRLFIFEGCRNLIRTIPLQQYAKGHSEDLDSKDTDDHAVDALRYLLATRPINRRERRFKTGRTMEQKVADFMRRKDKKKRRAF